MPNTRGKSKRDLLRAANDVQKAQLQLAWQVDTFADLPGFSIPLLQVLEYLEGCKQILEAMSKNYDAITDPAAQCQRQ